MKFLPESPLLLNETKRNSPVEVVKEAEEVESKLDEALLLVLTQGTEDLCGVKHVLSVHDPS